ncbi:hypothetical protein [Dyadobacter bucti]|uniref:hypothetical protein n=1 Tax=Dyadobacter bucti TaxID=2572203 RepID=UPI0011089449|nr:hypothetical protein [Dyadobacter bucti]
MAKKNTTKTPDEAQEVSSGYLVLSPFRDRDNFEKAYEEGDDVSHFDEALLESLVSRGLIEAPKKTVKPKSEPTDDAAKAAAEKAAQEADAAAKLKAEQEAKAAAENQKQ